MEEREKASFSRPLRFGPHRREFPRLWNNWIPRRLEKSRGGGSRSPPLRELHNESVRRERKGKNAGWQSRLVPSRSSFLCGDRWNFGTDKERIPRGCFFLLSPSAHGDPCLSFRSTRALRIQAAFLSLFVPLIWLYQLESAPFYPYRVCILLVPLVERVPRPERKTNRHDSASSLTLPVHWIFIAREGYRWILTSSLESNIPWEKEFQQCKRAIQEIYNRKRMRGRWHRQSNNERQQCKKQIR